MLSNLRPSKETITNLPKQDAADLYREAEALEEWKRKNKLFSIYPDTGPLRRELYPKHLQFFAAGAHCNERAAIAGNRCFYPWSPIEMGSSTRLISELIGVKDFYVSSWGGNSRCKKKAGGVFLKGIEPMFLLTTDTGEAFGCSLKHRVLTAEGWMSLYKFVQLSRGLRGWKISPDYPASYDGDGRLYGELPRWEEGNGNGSPLQQGDAQEHIHCPALRQDALEHVRKCIHAYLVRARHPSLDDPEQIEALCAQFEDPASLPAFRRLKGVRQELRRYVAEYCPWQASGQSDRYLPYEERRSGFLNEFPFAEENCEAQDMEVLGVQLSTQWFSAGQSKREFLENAPRKWTFDCFFPYSHPELVGGKKIHCIEHLGFQPVLDFTVEDTHNYISGGVVHSNTGKSFGIGGYETTVHLTGLYPEWWTGRRFHGPIDAWAAGDTSETTRDIIQQILFGNPGELGTGLIPYDCILGQPSHRAGVAGAIDTARIRHVSGGTSWIGLKSFDQGRAKYQGTSRDLIWLDESPPVDVYTECLTRLLTRHGLLICTFTPIDGISDVVLMYLPHMAPEPSTQDLEADVV